MSKEDGYKIRDEHGIHFVTFAVVEWVDVFTRKDYRDIIVDSLKYCQRDKGLKLYGWCLMSNHIHLVIAAEHQNTSDLLPSAHHSITTCCWAKYGALEIV